jgi:hypothetical protein
MLGGGAEKQQRQPLALPVHRRVTALLAHSFQPAKVVMLAEQLLTAPTLPTVREQHHADLFQVYLRSLGALVGRRLVSFHAAEPKKF